MSDPQPKTRPRLRTYIFQAVYAFIFLLLILLTLGHLSPNSLLHAIGATSLASSVTLVMLAPHLPTAQPKSILGGYVIGVLTGVVGCLIYQSMPDIPFFQPFSYQSVVAALCVALALFMMAVTNFEHPPATGITVGLILDPWHWHILGVVAGGTLMLSALRYLLRNQLISLL